MKKIIAIFLTFVLLLSLVACNNKQNDDTSKSTEPTNTESTTNTESELTTEPTTESTTEPELEEIVPAEIEFEKYTGHNWNVDDGDPYLGKIKQIVMPTGGMFPQVGKYDGDIVHYHRKHKMMNIGAHEEVLWFADKVVLARDAQMCTVHVFNEVNDVFAELFETTFEMKGHFIGAGIQEGYLNVIHSFNNSFYITRVNLAENNDPIVYDLSLKVNDERHNLFAVYGVSQTSLVYITSDFKWISAGYTGFNFENNEAVVTPSGELQNYNVEQIYSTADHMFPLYFVSVPNDLENIYHFSMMTAAQSGEWYTKANKIKLPDGYTPADISYIDGKYIDVIIKLADGKYCTVSKSDVTKEDGSIVTATMMDQLNKYSDQIVSVHHDGSYIVALFTDGNLYKIK